MEGFFWEWDGFLDIIGLGNRSDFSDGVCCFYRFAVLAEILWYHWDTGKGFIKEFGSGCMIWIE